jgi:hypothetical protein
MTAPFHGHGAPSATAVADEFRLTASFHGHGNLQPAPDGAAAKPALAGHGALTATRSSEGAYGGAAISGHGTLSETAKAKKFIFTAPIGGHGHLGSAPTAYAKFKLTAHAAGLGFLRSQIYPLFKSAAALPGHGVLHPVTGANGASAPHSHGALTATAHATKFVVTSALHGHGVVASKARNPAVAPHGHGTLSGLINVSGTKLVFFPVTGDFYAVTNPSPSGNTNTPVIQPINALITFTPSIPEGDQIYISNLLVTGAFNATQTVYLLGGPSSGTFNLSFEGDTTTTLPWNATPLQVQNALAALGTIGAGNVTVTTSPYPQAYTVSFTGALAAQQINTIGGDATNLVNEFGAGFCEIVSTINQPGSPFIVGDTAISLPPLTARIFDGVLSTIDFYDTPGFQLLANTPSLNLSGPLNYDITFSNVTFNGADQALVGFSFTAPTNNTPVCISATTGLGAFTARIKIGAEQTVHALRQPTWNTKTQAAAPATFAPKRAATTPQRTKVRRGGRL